MRRTELPWGSPANDPTPIAEIASWYRTDAAARAANGSTADDVPERTWRDLDGDTLLRGLDHTRTPLGRQRLYATMREPESATQRALIDDVAQRCSTDRDLRNRLIAALAHHHGSGGYRMWQLLAEQRLTTGWMRAAPLVTLLLLLLLSIVSFVPSVIVAIVPLAFVGLAVRLFGLSRIGAYIGPLRELAPVLRTARAVAQALDADAHADPSLRALVSDLRPAEVGLASVARWARLVNPDLVASNEILASLYEYINLVLLLDVNALVFVGESLARHRTAIDRVCRAVGTVDVALSVASFRSTGAWCRPTFQINGAALAFTALRHPLLRDGVPNDLTLSAGQGLLLTGANMSGKSTLLRALGVNVLMGRALATCSATSATLPITSVYTCIGHTDDLERGVSYFYAEAEAVAELLRRSAEQRALLLFDELFRGTNAAERLAAAEMTLRHVVAGGEKTGGQFVAIATHDLQLGDFLSDCFRSAHLTVSVDGASLHFAYTLASGPAQTRTALALLRQLGVPGDWLEEAARRASKLER
jgi:DNA mismatch repair ATPase MutS